MIKFNTCGFVSEEKTAQQKKNTQEVNSKATKLGERERNYQWAIVLNSQTHH